ncbi:MAG: CcmD family protein [Thermoanaerobaculia bacterium]
MLENMPSGVIAGGWNFVVAAYSITAIGLFLYAWSLIRRTRQQAKKEEKS